MVLDTSALLAILFHETEGAAFSQAIEAHQLRLISAVSMIEAAIVVESKFGPAGTRELDLLIHEAAIEVVPFDAGQAQIARRAWQKYGKGRHPAGLNLGDCCAYALSRSAGEPLLFKGGDFAQTDVTRA